MMCLVVTVSAIIVMLYVSVLYVVVFPSYEYYFHTFIGMFHFVIENMILGMVVYSYRKVVTTGPGRIPARWAPEGFTEEELEEAKQCSSSEKYRKRFYDHHIVRFCRKCNSFKPPRSHHCSECDVFVIPLFHLPLPPSSLLLFFLSLYFIHRGIFSFYHFIYYSNLFYYNIKKERKRD